MSSILHIISEPSKPFTDETRLSKLMRRLQRENDRERRLLAVKQLNEYISNSENAKVSSQQVFIGLFPNSLCINQFIKCNFVSSLVQPSTFTSLFGALYP